jgi:hypothetical protein
MDRPVPWWGFVVAALAFGGVVWWLVNPAAGVFAFLLASVGLGMIVLDKHGRLPDWFTDDD